MSEANGERYIPWSDDALLPGESPYAFLNKLGWFAGRGPVQLMRDLRITSTRLYPDSPTRINYDTILDDWNSEKSSQKWPILESRLLKYFDRTCYSFLDSYDHTIRIARFLRFCPLCISTGMHYGVTQLNIVEYCPYHFRRLISNCPECGEKIKYECSVLDGAFSCGACKRSLLESVITDISANQAYRRDVWRAHKDLESNLKCAPLIYGFKTALIDGIPQLPGVMDAMTKMLNESRSCQLDTETSSLYTAAVKVVRNDRGQLYLKHFNKCELLYEEEPNRLSIDDNVHRLAQLRVGAWALDRYHDHIFCICAARELISRMKLSELGWDKPSVMCCVGRGFAIWDATRSTRNYDELPSNLCRAWRLESIQDRAFASYVVEKACLASAIMPFFRNQEAELSEWEKNGFQSSFSQWQATNNRRTEKASDQSVLWQDLSRLDFSELCEISRSDAQGRVQWFERRCVEVRGRWGRINLANLYATHAMRESREEFDTRRRVDVAKKTLHETINHRGYHPC